MVQNTLFFGQDRMLLLRPLSESIEKIKHVISVPFAVMLPAFSEEEQSMAKSIVELLLEFGCIEFCCVGKQAEELHDNIDWIIEDKNVLNVTTTWHHDIEEACEYFVYASGAINKCLLALVGEHSKIISVLYRLVKELNQ